VRYADGSFQKNKYNACWLNKFTSKKGADGSFSVQFGWVRSQDSELLAGDE
jgi:hypothetical protein